MNRIYLDNNATTAPIKEVANEIAKLFRMPFNSSAVHSFGREANSIVEAARIATLETLGISNKQDYRVIFTASGTEANNLAIQGFGADHYFCASTEHSSVLNTTKAMKNYTIISVDNNGMLNLNELEEKLAGTEGKKLLAVHYANNETGVVQDITKIDEIAKKYNVTFLSDYVQAMGKIPAEMADIDMVTMAAHKFGGPQGVGVLVTKKSITLKPLMYGGAQEMGLRPGSMNVRAIAGFKIAMENIPNRIEQNKEIEKLRDYAEVKLKNFSKDVRITSEDVERLPNTISVSMPNVDKNTQLIYFDLAGICVSSGSACSSGKVAISNVLKAMNVEEGVAKNTIRVCLGPENTKDEIDKFLKSWEELYTKHNIAEKKYA
jgi:cysteine desulfurase